MIWLYYFYISINNVISDWTRIYEKNSLTLFFVKTGYYYFKNFIKSLSQLWQPNFNTYIVQVFACKLLAAT